MSLFSQICFQQIKDNFWYGMFGDFTLIIDKDQGTFNATKLCHDGGRNFWRWLQNKQSEEYITYLKDKKYAGKETVIITKVEGGRGPISNLIRGTYVCDDLITNIACWISPEFSDKVNQIVCRYIIDKQLKELEEDITPKTVNENKLHVFALIAKNDNSDDVGHYYDDDYTSYPYYVLRTQRASYAAQLNKLKRKYPDLEVLHLIHYNPNSINLFNRMKEKINKMKYYFNHVRLLKNYSLDEFIEDINKLTLIDSLRYANE